MFRALKPHLAPPFAPVHREEDDGVVTLGIPGYRQVRSYSCGFASALMVVRYFGLAVGGRELFDLLGTDRSGTRQSAIVRALRRLGLAASLRYDADFERMARGIGAGKVIIGYLHDVEHWLVVYGYGRRPERVFVADPRPGQPCEHPWSVYGERLGDFGIFCSLPERARRHPAPPPLEPGQLTFDFGRARE